MPPSASPTAAPTKRPSVAPSLVPSPIPSAAPSAPPAGLPTLAPSLSPTDARQCAAGYYRGQSGECAECTAEKAQGGCPPAKGGFPTPSPNGSACLCSCRFYWEGADCSHCPTGYGGLDCDRCAAGGAEPPQCAPPQCADPASLPAEVVTECGGGARQIALQPALHHKGISAAVTLAASSPAGTPLLSLPSHAPAQRLGGGGLRLEGAEAQLRVWLRLRIVPAKTLTHREWITVSVGISGSDCVPITVHFSLRCPAPAPRVTGALPSAAVPEGGNATIDCPLAALAHVDDPFKVTSQPPGAVSYEHGTQTCTVSASALPSPVPDNGTTAVVTVEAPSGARVALPLHIEIVSSACSSRVRPPLYIQLPPSGKGYESVGSIPLAGLNSIFSGFLLIGSHKGVAVAALGSSLRITASHEAVEGTFYVRLLYAVPAANCSEAQPVRTFWGPGIVGPSEHIREPIAAPFERVLAARALSSVGSPPWCEDPVLHLAKQPGGLELRASGAEWVLSGVIHSAGAQLAYITATDCRGGSASIRVELFGVDGTELEDVPATAYLEDTPLRLPVPRVLSTAENLTLSVAPQLDGQLGKGVLSASCPADVIVAQERPALALQLSGSPQCIAECKVTLTPIPNGCDNLDLRWWALGAALHQLLPGACSPDPPVATPRTQIVRWGDYVKALISTLVHSVDHGNCLENTTASNTSQPWLKVNGMVIEGRASRKEGTQCQTINTYTCQTNLSAMTSFCANSLPDARIKLAPEVIECLEDVPCSLHDNISIERTELTRNETPIALVIASTPPVLRELRFNASPADAPEVRSSGNGEVRAEGPFVRLWLQMPRARVLVDPDFTGQVNISVRGAVGTAVGEAGPLRIRFAPVNDAPRCNDSCEDTEISCGFVGGDKVNLTKRYKDVDDPKLGFGANETSHGVRIVGNMLVCTSFLALLTFYGIPLRGSAQVYALDPTGAVSPAIAVKVVYELTGSETMIMLLITVAISVYGTFILLFRPGAVSVMRNRRRLLCGGGRPGRMVCRVGREAAAFLRAAALDGMEVLKAGCGLLWLCDDGCISQLAASAPSGEIMVRDCGVNLVIAVQPESAFDPGIPLICAVLSVKRLSLGGAPKLSVLHDNPATVLRLCLRLRHQGDEKATLVWAAGVTRCMAAALGSGPELVDYTGTAQQLTEFAHMHRVVGAAECQSELVWTLHEGKSDRALLGGAIPVGQPVDHEASFCGGDEAASPKGAGPAAAAAAGSVSAADTLSNPLLPVVQQQQLGTATRPRIQHNSRRPATKLELQELSQKVEQMKHNEQRMEERIQKKELQMKEQMQELRQEMEKRLAKKSEQLPPEAWAQRASFHQLRGGGRGSTPPQPLLPPRPRGHASARGGPLRPQLGPSVPGPRLLTVTPATPQLPRAPPGQSPNSASPPRAPQQSPSRSAISRTQQGGGGWGRSGYTSE